MGSSNILGPDAILGKIKGEDHRALTKQATLNMLFHFQFAVTNDSYAEFTS